MIVDIVDKYLTDDNNPIKNLRLRLSFFSVKVIKSSKSWIRKFLAMCGSILHGWVLKVNKTT